MDARPVITTYVGASARTMTFTLKDTTGTVINLTGKTLTLTAKYAGTTKINAGAMTVSSPTTGVATITPTAAQLDVAGDYVAQIKIASAGPLYDFSEVFIIRVREVV
ncbi:MAG TPA: BppU family phage baseplate upper protein [Candidatus Krumholzibacteria bacterium]|nr:BppU family phage baseplate upper protein [Candidatus Krumholzibacteria bacterium]HPD73519.1 BppU family phage baseplate upper protein [Candidatus Krumholzibacteria bacterium]HRY42241.1 BppU family phage baseplate upper protein [Candidatus Krumholzibacteria bacterium]